MSVNKTHERRQLASQAAVAKCAVLALENEELQGEVCRLKERIARLEAEFRGANTECAALANRLKNAGLL